MSIRKREDWGTLGPLPADGLVVASDREARHEVERARTAGTEPRPLGLAGGDLCTTLGGRGDLDRLRSPQAARLVVDVCRVRLDGAAPQWFVAHLVARRSWWTGRVVAVMNAAWIGSWNVAPRAHPGDGAFDVVDGSPSTADRWKARSRLPLGTHVPHPAIATSRAAHRTIELDRPSDVWLDGERVGRARHLEITIEADALAVVV